MDDPTAFVTARLDEDEAIAQAAASEAGPDWTWDRETRDGYLRTPGGTIMADALNVEDEQFRPHVARHDPARVLREVAAKRRILAEHQPEPLDGDGGSVCDRCADWTEPTRADEDRRMSWPCSTVRQLAAVWSGHPDYRQEWST